MKKVLACILALTLALSVVTVMADGIAVKDEHPVLKILMGASSYDLNTTIEAGVIEEATGYHVEYESLPAENAGAATLLKISSNEDYDLVNCAGSTFASLRNNNMILPLNDYIDAIAPELWDCIPVGAWNGVSDEAGNVYAFSKLYTIQEEVCANLAIRWDLATAAGITEKPTTLDELYEMLKTLKDFYGDEYIIWTGPYIKGVVGNKMGIPLNISGAFGIYNDWMVDKDGKVIYYTEHENFPALIEYMTRLYNEGLLDVDYAINKSGDVDEKFSSGKALVASCSRETISSVAAALQETGIGLDAIEFVGALKGEDGTCFYQQTSVFNNYNVIPAYSDNAADVVNWIDLKIQNQEIINLGVEGTHFTWGDDGYPIPIQPTFTDERNKSSVYVTFANMYTFPTLFAARLRKNDAIWKEYTQSTIEYNKNNENAWLPAYFAFCSYDDYTAYNPNLAEELNIYLRQLVSGVKTIDTLDTFMSDFRNNEGETVREALQRWYDTYYAS